MNYFKKETAFIIFDYMHFMNAVLNIFNFKQGTINLDVDR